MELRHLRYFIAAAEESTLVGAAKRLRLAQPALTRQIRDLEKDVGVALFERDSRGVELTPAGEVCLASARHILHQVDVAIQQARGASEGVVGLCVICSGVRALGSGLLARIVARVHSQYPAIDLKVTEAAGTRQWKQLQLLEADIGLGVPAPAEVATQCDLVAETFDYDVFDSIAISSTHALAQRPRLSLSDLQAECFITWKADPFADFARDQRTEFRRLGFKPSSTREFEDYYSIVTMVVAGLGWTLCPSASTGVVPNGVTVIPLEDFKLLMPHAMLSRRTEARPVVQTVLGVIRRLVSEERQAAGRAPLGTPASEQSLPVANSAEDTPPITTIELRHLRYFSAVAESESFGRAAERLGLTQPALSRQVRDLERSVGTELLVRGPRGANCTPAGESFLRNTRRILSEADALPAEAQRARRGMVSRCVVATVPTTSADRLLRELVRHCAEVMPKLELVLEQFHTPEQPDALRAARVDLGVCHASPLSPIEERGLRRERLVNDLVSCALLPADSELAQRKSIAFRDLADIPFIFPNRAFQPGLYDELFAIFEANLFRPRIEQSYNGLRTAWAMVADGSGWGVGFQSQCAEPPTGTVAVPVRGFAMPWGLDVLYREDEARTTTLLVLDMLHDVARATEHPVKV